MLREQSEMLGDMFQNSKRENKESEDQVKSFRKEIVFSNIILTLAVTLFWSVYH